MAIKPTAADVIAEARTWCGTRVIKHGRIKGERVDCLGLVYCVGVETRALWPDPGEPAEVFGYYGGLPSSERILAGLEAWKFAPIAVDDRRPGDVGAFALADSPGPLHLAILSELGGRAMLIHADPNTKPRGRVVEHGFSGAWPALAHSWWRYPNLRAQAARSAVAPLQPTNPVRR